MRPAAKASARNGRVRRYSHPAMARPRLSGSMARTRSYPASAAALYAARRMTGTSATRRSGPRAPRPPDEDDGDREDEERGEDLPQRADEAVDDRGLRGGDLEGVGRAVGVARRRPRRRHRVGVDHQRGGDEEDEDQQRRGHREATCRRRGQAPGGEREQEEDDARLDEPGHDAADAVDRRVRRLGQRRRRPQQGDHQQRPREAVVGVAGQGHQRDGRPAAPPRARGRRRRRRGRSRARLDDEDDHPTVSRAASAVARSSEGGGAALDPALAGALPVIARAPVRLPTTTLPRRRRRVIRPSLRGGVSRRRGRPRGPGRPPRSARTRRACGRPRAPGS